jgi:hypothetical protein
MRGHQLLVRVTPLQCTDLKEQGHWQGMLMIKFLEECRVDTELG